MVRGTSQSDYEKLLMSPHVLFFEDPAYINSTRDFRISCRLESIVLNSAADFTGKWILSDCESSISQDMGSSIPAFKLDLVQKDNSIEIKAVSHSEWSDDETVVQVLTLDGEDNASPVFMNAPGVQNAHWSPEKDTLTINSRILFKFGEVTNEIKSVEVWTLLKRGKKLEIVQKAGGFRGRGPSYSRLVYIRFPN